MHRIQVKKVKYLNEICSHRPTGANAGTTKTTTIASLEAYMANTPTKQRIENVFLSYINSSLFSVH